MKRKINYEIDINLKAHDGWMEKIQNKKKSYKDPELNKTLAMSSSSFRQCEVRIFRLRERGR